MFPSYLSNYVIYESQTSVEAFWKLEKQRLFLDTPILVVINENGQYIGIITRGALSRDIMHLDNPMALTAGDVCNRNGRICIQSANNRTEALSIFADNELICAIPVIDDAKNLTEIVFRQQVFYRDFYLGMVHGNQKLTMPRMQYARQIYEAAQLAKTLGFDSFSVIEFGVAGGNGLVACEFHIKEISRLFDLRIELYGFDSGEGLPDASDHRNASYLWEHGFYQLDVEKLKKRLQFAQLIIGDIGQTAGEFMQKANFAPIGVMLVDVDFYTSTVPILNMLRGATDRFLPRVHMFFHDIGDYLAHSGEKAAIDEFNACNQDIKLSEYMSHYRELREHQWGELYCAHLFKHDKYNINLYKLRTGQLASAPLF